MLSKTGGAGFVSVERAQHVLYFFPLPHGQGSLRPGLFVAIWVMAGNYLKNDGKYRKGRGANPLCFFKIKKAVTF